MTCACCQALKAERECCIEMTNGSDELGLLMDWTWNLQSLVMETEGQSLR